MERELDRGKNQTRFPRMNDLTYPLTVLHHRRDVLQVVEVARVNRTELDDLITHAQALEHGRSKM